jgi:tetratricopeptide (TPR) repeat protein
MTTANTRPAREMFDALRLLHRQAGAPSVRQIAARTGQGGLSHSTVHDILKGRRVPKWATFEQVVSALGGDPETFRLRWAAAAEAADDLSPRATGSRTAEPAVSLLASEHVIGHHARAEHLFTEGLYDQSIMELDLAIAALRHNRARALQSLNRWTEAQAEYEAVIAERTRLLGVDHPETLASRNNLALVLFDQGKIERARAEQLQILAIFQRLFGPEDPTNPGT